MTEPVNVCVCVCVLSCFYDSGDTQIGISDSFNLIGTFGWSHNRQGKLFSFYSVRFVLDFTVGMALNSCINNNVRGGPHQDSKMYIRYILVIALNIERMNECIN